eukprot:1450481-Prymnesium_polylepis.1
MAGAPDGRRAWQELAGVPARRGGLGLGLQRRTGARAGSAPVVAAVRGHARGAHSGPRERLAPDELPVVRVAEQLRVDRHAQLAHRHAQRRTRAVERRSRDRLGRRRRLPRAHIVRRGAAPAFDDAAVRVVRRPRVLAPVEQREQQHVACAAARRRAEAEQRRRCAVELREVHAVEARACGADRVGGARRRRR